MKLVFESLEELHAFYNEAFGDSEGSTEKPKRTRRSKKDDAGEGAQAGGAPAPMAPPASNGQVGTGGQAFTGFAPPAAGAGPGPGFVAPAAAPAPAPPTGPSPEITALVQRICTRIDAAIASGQNQDAALAWFRTECGQNAAQATMDQIKSHHLFQQTPDKLAYFAKVMNA